MLKFIRKRRSIIIAPTLTTVGRRCTS